MATTTGGTTTTTALTTLVFEPGGLAAADVATIAQGILDDLLGCNTATVPVPQRIVPGAFSQQGLLYVPNRGILKVLPGDVVMLDTTSGWPILVSAKAIAVASSLWNS